MTDHVFPQDGDFDDGAAFSFMHGRRNATDYVESGFTLTVDFTAPSVTVAGGKAFVSLDREEASQAPGQFWTFVSKGVEKTDAVTLALSSNATNYVYLVANVSETNEGADQDFPEIRSNTTGADPEPGSLLLGTVNTSANTVNETNRAPPIEAESLDVHEGATFGGDLTLDTDSATLTVGSGNGPHTIGFGNDSPSKFTVEHNTEDNNVRWKWGGQTRMEMNSTAGDLSLPLGSLTVAGSVKFGSGSGSALDLRTNSDGDHVVWRHDNGVTGTGRKEYSATSAPKNGGLLTFRDTTASTDLFRVATDGTLITYAGGVNADDGPITGVERLAFHPDSDQHIEYASASGPFRLRDTSNAGENVIDVGGGQMTLSRPVSVGGNLTATKNVDVRGVLTNGATGSNVVMGTGLNMNDKALYDAEELRFMPDVQQDMKFYPSSGEFALVDDNAGRDVLTADAGSFKTYNRVQMVNDRYLLGVFAATFGADAPAEPKQTGTETHNIWIEGPKPNVQWVDSDWAGNPGHRIEMFNNNGNLVVTNPNATFEFRIDFPGKRVTVADGNETTVVAQLS